jgi:hypothetical protein
MHMSMNIKRRTKMAQIEIYKIKKTADPKIKDFGMFEFFGSGGPYPENYVREWSGELDSGDLETLFGKFSMNPPKGYHGGALGKSDIAVVDGKAYFLDRNDYYSLEQINFDTSSIKDAIHVNYGKYSGVSVDRAAKIPQELVKVCEGLDIPIGYKSEPGYHGSDKGMSYFEPPYSRKEHETYYLHPHFLQGKEAQAFVDLLAQLFQTGCGDDIEEYLAANCPIYMSDLEAVRERFVPELLLPVELHPIYKAIPIGADKTEIDRLSAKVKSTNGGQRNVLYAAVEAGWHDGTVAGIVDIADNLDRFTLHAEYGDIADYGRSKLDQDQEEHKTAIGRLEKSGDPADHALHSYIVALEMCANAETYGVYITAKEENAAITQYGLVTCKHSKEGNNG